MKSPKFEIGQKVKVLNGFSIITKIKRRNACVGEKVKISKDSIYEKTPTTFKSTWMYEVKNRNLEYSEEILTYLNNEQF